jgi:hypothetical protein
MIATRGIAAAPHCGLLIQRIPSNACRIQEYTISAGFQSSYPAILRFPFPAVAT